MRKISRAEEQFTSLNFRTANGNRDWVEKNHADVMKNGFDCDVCGKKFPPGTDFDDIEENGGANKEAGRSCSPECTEELAERERDAEDGAATANAEWNYSRRASAAEVLNLLTPAAIVAQPFIMDKINKSNDKKSKQEETTSTEHTCDVGDHKVHEDVRCVTPDCEHRGKSWETDGHQDWDHDYACSEHFTKGTNAGIALEKEAGAAEIVQTIVNHLPLAVPAAVAGGAAITKVVDKIIKKKNAPPATGTEEAYNSTGFMSPQQVQERREASFDERYANEKTANQYIEKQGDSWVITQKSTGKVLSHHDSKEKAEASFRAMMQSKHGSVIAAKKCKCGHEEGAHMWDTKMDPQAESQMEDLGCRECGSWTRDGDFETDCKEFDADKDFRGQHSNLNSDW